MNNDEKPEVHTWKDPIENEKILCTALIYYIFGVKADDCLNVDCLYKVIKSEMDIMSKHMIDMIPQNHPAKVYYNKLNYLEKEDYENTVKSLKRKILKCKRNKKFKELFLHIDCDNDILFFSQCIVESVKYSSIRKYIKKAIDQNDVIVLIFVGKLFIEGQFVDKDVEKGLKYLYKSKEIDPQIVDENMDEYIEKLENRTVWSKLDI